MCEDLKSIAIFGQDWSEVIGIIDEKHHVVELIAAMKIGQKPPCRLLICRWKQAYVEDFIGVGIDSTVQPELLPVEADHLLVDRKLIRRHRRHRL